MPTTPDHEPSPKDEYAGRLDQREKTVRIFEQRDSWCANMRLAVFVAGLAVAWLALFSDLLNPWWLLAPVVAFVALVVLHEWIARKQREAELGVKFYEAGIARIEDRWAGKGVRGDDLMPKNHLYAEDLDLFGEASLFELLCTARTRAGEETLARWLTDPPDADEIRARQEAVAELSKNVDLREDLALLAGDLRARVRPALLANWSTAASILPQGARQALAIGITAGAVLSAAAWAMDIVTGGPLLVFVLLELAYLKWARGDIDQVIAAMDEPMKDLQVFAATARRLEEAQFGAAKLCNLQNVLTAEDAPASKRIAQLSMLFQWVDAARNQMFAPIAIVLMWRVHFAYAIERWRRRYGADAPKWLEAVGEFEALCALAGYAYEHPDDPFPEIAEAGAVYEGEDLGHPLLPGDTCVRNSVAFSDDRRMFIVSGSNMSGKSTLLRVVGINAVLAMMGAPVRATRLKVAPLCIGASLHIVDSIQSGTSHFYAEITRLHQIMERGKEGPTVLFLVDEILHGTNSKDRQTGAEAVLKGLLESGAIGLVTTHDLALTKIADTVGKGVENVHFVDQLKEDRLIFDYKMQPGVVERSNALALMRSIGLDV